MGIGMITIDVEDIIEDEDTNMTESDNDDNTVVIDDT